MESNFASHDVLLSNPRVSSGNISDLPMMMTSRAGEEFS